MKIRTKLILIAILPALTLFCAGLLHVVAGRVVEKANSRAVLANELGKSFSDLGVLVLEYHVYGESRVYEQCRRKFEQISLQISEAVPTFKKPEERRTLERIKTGFEAVGSLGRQLDAEELRTKSGADETSLKYTDHLTNRILQELHVCELLAGGLHEASHDAARAAARRQNIASIVMYGAFALFIPFIALLVIKAFSRPLGQVMDAINALSTGSFCRPIELDRKDEIGLLADAFNGMATARKTAEEALQESEHRLSDMLEHAHLAAIMLDREGRTTFCNDYMLRLTGWQREEVLGKDWFALFTPHRREDREVFLEAVTTGVLPAHYENEIVTREGKKRLVSWSNTLLRGPDNRIIGTTSLGEDITEQRRSEETVRKSEEQYRALVENTPDIIARFDREGRYLFANSAMAAITGREPRELIGKTRRDLGFSEESFAAMERMILSVFDTGQPAESEFVYHGKSGRRVYNWRFIPEMDQAGNAATVLSISRDITEHKQREEEARMEERRLRRLVLISQHKTATVRELLDFALDAVVSLSDSRIGFIQYYSEEEQEFTLHAWSAGVMDQCSVSNSPTLFRLEETGLWAEAVRLRKAIVVNEYQAPVPGKKGCPEGHARIDRFMSVPVFSYGTIVALVAVANKPTEYTQVDVRQLEQMMDSVWKIAEKKQAEDALWKLNEELEQRVAERTADLARANEQLEKLATLDGLTGLANRRQLNDVLDREVKRARRWSTSLSFLMCDVDHFKPYNDRYGHGAGDACLRKVAEALQTTFKRGTDLAGRYGGEEFAVVIPDTPPENVAMLAERLRLRVMGLAIPHEHSDAAPVITISIGVVSAVATEERTAAWYMLQADQALYQSKSEGRNRVTAVCQP